MQFFIYHDFFFNKPCHMKFFSPSLGSNPGSVPAQNHCKPISKPTILPISNPPLTLIHNHHYHCLLCYHETKKESLFRLSSSFQFLGYGVLREREREREYVVNVVINFVHRCSQPWSVGMWIYLLWVWIGLL